MQRLFTRHSIIEPFFLHHCSAYVTPPPNIIPFFFFSSLPFQTQHCTIKNKKLEIFDLSFSDLPCKTTPRFKVSALPFSFYFFKTFFTVFRNASGFRYFLNILLFLTLVPDYTTSVAPKKHLG